MCDSIKIVSGLLSYVVYFPPKVSFSFVWFMYILRNLDVSLIWAASV